MPFEERSEQASPSLAPLASENGEAVPPVEGTREGTVGLAFLRYLVQHGIVNEGFDQGQEPEQYRRK